MEDSLIAQGFELMLYGMGTVLLFLSLLVVATTAMSAILQRLFPAPEPIAVETIPTSAGHDPEIVAAISAALLQHRRRRD